MGEEACRYVVVKFVPDIVRNEPLNIGVILQCPHRKFIQCRFLTRFSRVARLYPDVDVRLLHSFADETASRVDTFMYGKQLEFGEIPAEEPVPLSSPAFLDSLFREYAGRFQFTKPQPTLAEDLEAELSTLFGIFVEYRTEARRRKPKRAPVGHPAVFRRLRSIFEEERVIDHLQPKITVEGKRWEYEFDFAYVNTYKGLIQSVAFDLANPEDKRDRAFSVAGTMADVLEKGVYERFSLILQAPPPEKADGYEEAKGYLAETPARVIPMEEAREYATALRKAFWGPRLFDGP